MNNETTSLLVTIACHGVLGRHDLQDRVTSASSRRLLCDVSLDVSMAGETEKISEGLPCKELYQRQEPENSNQIGLTKGVGTADIISSSGTPPCPRLKSSSHPTISAAEAAGWGRSCAKSDRCAYLWQWSRMEPEDGQSLGRLWMGKKAKMEDHSRAWLHVASELSENRDRSAVWARAERVKLQRQT